MAASARSQLAFAAKEVSLPRPLSHFSAYFFKMSVNSAEKREFDRKQKVTFPGCLSNRVNSRDLTAF